MVCIQYFLIKRKKLLEQPNIWVCSLLLDQIIGSPFLLNEILILPRKHSLEGFYWLRIFSRQTQGSVQCGFDNINGCSCFTIAAISFVQLFPLCRSVLLLYVYHNYRSTEILCKKLSRCLNSLTNNVHSLNSSSNCSLDNIPDIRSRTVTYLLMFKRWYKIRSGSLETEKWSVNAWGRHQLTVTCWCRANVCLLSAFQEAQRCKINGSSTLPHILLLFLIVSTFFAEWQFVNNF